MEVYEMNKLKWARNILKILNEKPDCKWRELCCQTECSKCEYHGTRINTSISGIWSSNICKMSTDKKHWESVAKKIINADTWNKINDKD